MTTECHSLLQLPPDVLTEVLRMLVTDVTVVSLLRSCTTFRNLIVEAKLLKSKKSLFLTNCAKHGYLELMKWGRQQNCAWNHTTCLAAAKNGSLPIFEYLITQGLTPNVAARYGNLDIIIFLEQHGFTIDYIAVCRAAVAGNSTEVYEWGMKSIAEKEPNLDFTKLYEELAYGACEKGDLSQIMAFLVPGISSAKLVLLSAKSGNIDCLRWFFERGADMRPVAPKAAKRGDLEMLKYLIDIGVEMDSSSLAAAAKHNHVDVFKWIALKCASIEDNVTMNISDLDLLIWAYDNGLSKRFVPGPQTTNEILMYVMKNGIFEWDMDNVQALVSVGRTKLLRIFMEYFGKTPQSIQMVDLELFIFIAHLGGYLKMLKFLVEIGISEYSRNLLSEPVKLGNPKVVQILLGKEPTNHFLLSQKSISRELLEYRLQNGFPWTSNDTTQLVRDEHWSLFQWAVETGLPRDTTQSLSDCVKGCGDPRIRSWAASLDSVTNNNK